MLAFKYRYDLTQYDLGISDSQSFVWTLLDRGSCSMKLEDLSEKQHKNLGAWISALFIAEGISEDTMSSCSPQEYYLLVSTLFSQTVGACEMGKLEFETLKGGLECEYCGIPVESFIRLTGTRSFGTVPTSISGFRAHLVRKLHLGVGGRTDNCPQSAPRVGQA